MFQDIAQKIKPEQEIILSRDVLKGIKYDFNDAQIFEDWQNRTYIAVKYDKSFQAYKMLKELEKNLLQQDDSLNAKYREILIWLYYAYFDSLEQREVLDFFIKKNFTIILQDENYGDLIKKIKLRMSKELLEERDKWREKIFNAMHENGTSMTDRFVVEGKMGTISNWIKEYDKEIGTGIAESIARAEFENKSSISAHLTDKDKEILKKFLDFYEFIKISSYDPAGFEESFVAEVDGDLYLFDNGEQINLSVPDTKKGFKQNAVLNLETQQKDTAKKDLPDYTKILQQTSKVLSETKGDSGKIIELMYDAITRGAPIETLGSLLLLAQLRKLDTVLSDNKNMNSIVLEDLKKTGQDDTVQGFKINPNAPQYLARFLKVVLEEKLKLSTIDATIFGKKISQVLAMEGEKYANIVKDGKWNL
jgi:hypothetical protein